MNSFILALVLVAVPLAACNDDKYDKLDADKFLADEALFSSYTACLLDKGPCTDEHSEHFRKIFPELISSACAKCTANQKSNVRKIARALQERKPNEFVELQKKYDPKGEHEKAFNDFVLGSD